MSKQIPILFSTAMVQAVLEDKKTMTRRVMKPQPHESITNISFGYSALTPAGSIELRGKFDVELLFTMEIRNYYQNVSDWRSRLTTQL